MTIQPLRLFGDPVFLQVLGNTFAYLVLGLPISLGLAFLIAYHLDRIRTAETVGLFPSESEGPPEIARTLIFEPKIVLLDEPAAGLSINRIEELDQLLRRIRNERGTGRAWHELGIAEGAGNWAADCLRVEDHVACRAGTLQGSHWYPSGKRRGSERFALALPLAA